MNKDDSVFIKHILNSIGNIENFMKNISKTDFKENVEKQSAVIRQIEIIGEATKNISESLKDKNKTIGWKEISGTRDKMIHNYFGVYLDIVWAIVKINLPELKKQMILLNKKLEIG